MKFLNGKTAGCNLHQTVYFMRVPQMRFSLQFKHMSQYAAIWVVESRFPLWFPQGEVLYRVRWKNYTSDEDTWEPEAHLEDCREVLLAYRKKLAEVKAKKDTGMVS